MLLKLYIDGYLNRVQASRRLGLETQRNVGLIWLTERLAPDRKTMADLLGTARTAQVAASARRAAAEAFSHGLDRQVSLERTESRVRFSPQWLPCAATCYAASAVVTGWQDGAVSAAFAA